MAFARLKELTQESMPVWKYNAEITRLDLLCKEQIEYTLVELYLSGLKLEVIQYVEGNLGHKNRRLKEVMDIALVYDCIKFLRKVGCRQAPKERKKEENHALQVVHKPVE
jgi:hypothetical protein